MRSDTMLNATANHFAPSMKLNDSLALGMSANKFMICFMAWLEDLKKKKQ